MKKSTGSTKERCQSKGKLVFARLARACFDPPPGKGNRHDFGNRGKKKMKFNWETKKGPQHLAPQRKVLNGVGKTWRGTFGEVGPGKGEARSARRAQKGKAQKSDLKNPQIKTKR